MSAAGASGRQQIDALTGVRALASWWVLLYHVSIFATPLWGTHGALGAVVNQGFLGVDFFFVLSGFILALQYLTPLAQPTAGPVKRFLLLRLARIYPLHVVTMLGVLVVNVLGSLAGQAPANPHQTSLSGAVANLLLIHSWGWMTTYTWNEPSWSISCEWFAYLCFPLIAMTYSRIRRPASAWLATLLPLVAMIGTLHLLGEKSMGQPLRYGLLRISGEFLCGCGVFLLVRAGVTERLPSWSAFAVLAVLGLVVGFKLADPWAVPLFALLILALVANPKSVVAKLLATSFMVLMGELSYSLYMINQRVILWTNHLLPYERVNQHPQWFRLLALFGLIGVILLAAYASYRLIEMPCREIGRKWIDRKFPRAAVQQAVIHEKETEALSARHVPR